MRSHPAYTTSSESAFRSLTIIDALPSGPLIVVIIQRLVANKREVFVKLKLYLLLHTS